MKLLEGTVTESEAARLTGIPRLTLRQLRVENKLPAEFYTINEGAGTHGRVCYVKAQLSALQAHAFTRIPSLILTLPTLPEHFITISDACKVGACSQCIGCDDACHTGSASEFTQAMLDSRAAMAEPEHDNGVDGPEAIDAIASAVTDAEIDEAGVIVSSPAPLPATGVLLAPGYVSPPEPF